MRKGTLGLSNSEMAQWKRCRRKWYLGSYRGLKKRVDDEAGSATWVGNFVHEALAWYYDPANNFASPVAYAESLLDQAIQDAPGEETNLRKEFVLVKLMLEGYMEWLAESGADADLKILGSERMVRVPLRQAGGEPLGVYLLSKLDVPVERNSDGQRLALEHKTVQHLSQPLIGFRIDAQFLTEHLARFLGSIEAGMTPEEALRDCSGVLVNMLRKVKRTGSAKPPFFGREEVRHNIHELRSHWRHVVEIASEIAAAEARLDAGESHHTVCPPTPIPDRCSWDCPFFKVCPMADDGSDFEGVLGAVYEEHDPLERYEGAEEL